ncbi:MAG TPA: OB-fold domain-containing protein [Myxococcota bacterium]
MSTAASLRPVPLPDEVTAPFWEGCRRGELRMQRCAACARFRFLPRPLCPHCKSFESEWVRMSGEGSLFSFVICHPPVLPAFQAQAPYAVALVELAEDPALRLVGGVLGVAPDRLSIGQQLRVDFEEISDGVVLPQWRLAP